MDVPRQHTAASVFLLLILSLMLNNHQKLKTLEVQELKLVTIITLLK